jgi:hypothetical protein
MTPIFSLGAINHPHPEDGFLLLRGLLIMFIIIFCFAALMGSITVYARQGTAVLQKALNEIQRRNELQLRQVSP